MSEQDFDVTEIPTIDPRKLVRPRKRKLVEVEESKEIIVPEPKKRKVTKPKKIKVKEEISMEEKKSKIVGTKKEVFDGIADHTKGGLKKNDFIKNKRGKIVSIKKAQQGAIAFEKYLKPALMKICESNK